MSSDRSCVICGKDSSSKSTLHLHVLRHLGYRRYSCSSCNLCFYTEDEREEHCRATSHINMFEMKVNQYNEMLVKQLLKDIDVSTKFDLDIVIRERARAALVYDKAIEDLPNPAKKRSKSILSSPNSTNRTNTRSSPAPADPSSDTNDSPPKKSKLTTPKPRKSNSASESNANFDTSLTNSDHLNVSELLQESMTTNVEEVRCKLCKTKVSYLYEIRKNHVSLSHMPSDHNENDYVDILEHKMQEAFPGSSYSDYQCQFANCSKVYKSQSSRRAHVLSCHFNCQIECPMEECNAVFTDAFKAHTHLKVEHRLADGAKSIKNTVLKYKFEYEKRAHNSKLEKTVRRAFPCPIPVISKCSEKEAGKDSIIRDGPDRFFQKLPPLPRRARSSSSSESEASPNKLPPSTSTPKRTSTTESKKEGRQLENELRQADTSCHSESSTPSSEKLNNSSTRKKRTQSGDSAPTKEKEKTFKRVKLESISMDGAEVSSVVDSLSSELKDIDDPTHEDSKDFPKLEDYRRTDKGSSEFRYECNKRKALLATPPCSKKISSPAVSFRFTPKYTRMSNSIMSHVTDDEKC